MTDHKFADEKNILLLLKWSDDLYANTKLTPEEAKTLLALINRQKAEIESLQAVHADMTESLRLAAEANKDMQAEIEKLKGSRNRWKQIATDFDKASRETEKEIERLTTLAELGNMRANDYREMRNKLKKANAEIEKLGRDRYQLLPDGRVELIPRTDINAIRAEAIKEFAQRLKKKMYPYNGVDKKKYAINAYAVEQAIECIAKEMTEANK